LLSVTRLQISCSAPRKVHRSSKKLLFHLTAILCFVYLHDFHIVMIHEQGYCVWLDDVHTSKSDAHQAHQYSDVISSGGKMTLNSE
jgi:hypothetical protein